jgi:hypothetical protein
MNFASPHLCLFFHSLCATSKMMIDADILSQHLLYIFALFFGVSASERENIGIFCAENQKIISQVQDQTAVFVGFKLKIDGVKFVAMMRCFLILKSDQLIMNSLNK